MGYQFNNFITNAAAVLGMRRNDYKASTYTPFESKKRKEEDSEGETHVQYAGPISKGGCPCKRRKEEGAV